MGTIRKHRGPLIVFGIILALVLTFCVLLFWNSSYNAGKVEMSSKLVNKVGISLLQSGKLELDSDEVNQIVNAYFKSGKYSNITVKGIKAEVKDDDLYFYTPVNYKGFNLLVTTYGNLSYKNSGIEYKITSIKVGKVPISKGLFYNKLESKAKGKLSIKDDAIYIDKSKIPFTIKSIEINNSKMTVVMEKLPDEIKKNIAPLLKIIGKGSLDSGIQKILNSTSTVSGNKTSSSSQPSESNSQQASGKNTGERDAALDRVTGSLNSAMSSASTGGAKNVISQMISAANSMRGNPNANPYSYAGSVRAACKNLSAQEKMDLKAALSSNVNGNDISIISSMLGK